MNKYTLITIIIGCLILGISYGIVQTNKQQSIELIQLREIEQKENELEFEKDKQMKIELAKFTNQKLLDGCLQLADDAYWDYARLNGTENEDGSIYAQNNVWDSAAKNKKIATEICFNKYK